MDKATVSGAVHAGSIPARDTIEEPRHLRRSAVFICERLVNKPAASAGNSHAQELFHPCLNNVTDLPGPDETFFRRTFKG